VLYNRLELVLKDQNTFTKDEELGRHCFRVSDILDARMAGRALPPCAALRCAALCLRCAVLSCALVGCGLWAVGCGLWAVGSCVWPVLGELLLGFGWESAGVQRTGFARIQRNGMSGCVCV
jgi:hypothetical protein